MLQAQPVRCGCAEMEIFKDIPFDLDFEALLASLHLQRGSADAEALSGLMDAIRPYLRPKAVYRESFIEDRKEDEVTIDGIVFTSRILRSNLDQVERVFPLVATCGKEIDELDLAAGDILKQYWIDEIKSIALSAALKHLNEHLKQRFALGKTSSMSPGSGDAAIWPIEQQKNLFSLLGDGPEQIGVQLTDSCLMIPNKSVSGIRFPTEIEFKSCQVCHREDCPGRIALFDEHQWKIHRPGREGER